MPVQYYLPRNELTYRFRYTKNNIPFKHYLEKSNSFIVCCIAALVDHLPSSEECHTTIDFLHILLEGYTSSGLSLNAFFREETRNGTLPDIVEQIHYAFCLFLPSKHTLAVVKCHVRLFQHSTYYQYITFLKQTWNSDDLNNLLATSIFIEFKQ